MLDFNNINFVAVLVASILAFGIGVVWYTALFGKSWEAEVKLTKEQLEKPNYLQTYGGSFVLMIVMMTILSVILKSVGINEDGEWLEGAKTGLVLGLTMSATSIGINYLYQFKSIKLFAIDASYQTIFLTLGAIVLTIWN